MSKIATDELKHQISQLLREYQQSPSEKVRNQLVELNFGLVRKEAYYWVNQCHESYEDLLQVGCIGLIKAIEKFEISLGNAFSSYAMPYIRGEIQHYLRDKSVTLKIPRHWLEIQQVLLAGSFGSYLSPASAVKIGLVPKLPVMRIVSAGNVAGEGAKMVLLSAQERNGAMALLDEIDYIELSDRADFNDKFVERLSFPA